MVITDPNYFQFILIIWNNHWCNSGKHWENFSLKIRQLSACRKAKINEWKCNRTFCTTVLYLSIFNQGHNSSRLKFKRWNHHSVRGFCPKSWAKPNQTDKTTRNRNEMLRELIQHNSSKVQIHSKYFWRVALDVY